MLAQPFPDKMMDPGLLQEKWLTLEDHENIVEEKTKEITDTIPQDSNADYLKGKLRAYKGQFTKAETAAAEEYATFERFEQDDYNSTIRSTLYKCKDKLCIYRNVLEYIYDLYLVVCTAEVVDVSEREAADIAKRFAKSSSQLTLGICRVEAYIKKQMEDYQVRLAEANKTTTLNRGDQTNEQVIQRDQNVPRIASSLKPETLEISVFPVAFNHWVQRCGEYLRANHVPDMQVNRQQISYCRPLIKDTLYTAIEPYITRETVAVIFNEGDDTVRMQLDPPTEHPTFLELLGLEWRRQYPLAQRRLQLFQAKQQGGEETTTWLSQLERQFEAAEVRTISPEELEILFATNGLYDKALQKEALKDFTDGKIKGIPDIRNLVRNEDITSRTSNYMKGETKDRAFKTEYKKQKSKGKGQKGRSKSKDQKDQKKWCDYHKSKSHSNDDCRSQKSEKGQEKGQEKERYRSKSRGRSRHRSPSPRYPSRSPSSAESRSPSPRKDKINFVRNTCNFTIKGQNSEQLLPIMPFTFETKANRKPKYFIVPCYADTGSSRSVISYKTAKDIKVDILPAPNEGLYNASNEKMIVNGKCKVMVSLKGKRKILVDALISQDLDNDDEGPVNLISLKDLEDMKIINISKYATKQKKVVEKSRDDYAFKTDSKKTYDEDFPPLPPTGTLKISSSTKPKTTLDSVDVENMSYGEIMDLLKREYSDIITNVLPEQPMNVDPYIIEINKEKAKEFPPRPATGVKAWPLHMEDACARVLDNLEKEHVIRKLEADETTPYLATSLFVKKKDPTADPRLVTNHDRLNLNVDRQMHPINSPQALMQRIEHDSRHWIGFDLLKGYNQIPLAAESQILTAFLTPKGRYCYKRLSMGCVLSGDVFNIYSDRAFEGQKILKCVDDVAFSAPTKVALLKKARRIFDICRKYNMAISEKKLQVNKTIEFVGYKITENKVAMDDLRIQAIKDFVCPSTMKQVRSWTGLCNTFTRHHVDLAMALKPINQLLKKGVAFQITPEIQKSFEDTKAMLCKSPILSAFEKGRKTILVSDASVDGFGHALLQMDKHVKNKYYLIKAGSRATKPNQRSHAINELEMEGLRYALNECSFYIYGMKKEDLHVYTDHKPLTTIMQRPLEELVSPRHIRCKLDLLKYDFTLHYTPGQSKLMMIADQMSRRTLWKGHDLKASDEDCEVEDFSTRNIALLVQSTSFAAKSNEAVMNDDVTPIFLQNMAKATLEDDTLQILAKAIKSKTKFDKIEDKDKIYAYKDVYNDLTVNEMNLILFEGDKIVVPKSERPNVLSRIHCGHPGIQRSKAIAREFYFFPDMLQAVKNQVSNCDLCQMYMRSNPIQKVNPEFENPDEVYAMSHVSSDILQVEQRNFIVCRDRFSGFIMVKKVASTTSQTIRDVLNSFFLNYGYPTFLQVDQAPNFNSEIMQSWATENEFKIINSSPYMSRSAGLVEQANRICKELYLKSKSYEEFERKIFEYNNLRRSDSNFTPAQLFIGRRMRGKITMMPEKLKEGSNQKLYADRLEKRSSHYKKFLKGRNLADLKKGDVVRVQNIKTKFWDTTGVIKKKIRGEEGQSSSYEVLIGGKTMKHRNKRYLRKIQDFYNDPESSESDLQSSHTSPSRKTSILYPAEQLSPSIFGPADTSKKQGFLRRSSRNKRVSWDSPIVMQRSSKNCQDEK